MKRSNFVLKKNVHLQASGWSWPSKGYYELDTMKLFEYVVKHPHRHH